MTKLGVGCQVLSVLVPAVSQRTSMTNDHDIVQRRKHLVFYVNGSKQEAFDVQPETTLLQYLRMSGLTGTWVG